MTCRRCAPVAVERRPGSCVAARRATRSSAVRFRARHAGEHPDRPLRAVAGAFDPRRGEAASDGPASDVMLASCRKSVRGHVRRYIAGLAGQTTRWLQAGPYRGQTSLLHVPDHPWTIARLAMDVGLSHRSWAFTRYLSVPHGITGWRLRLA